MMREREGDPFGWRERLRSLVKSHRPSRPSCMHRGIAPSLVECSRGVRVFFSYRASVYIYGDRPRCLLQLQYSVCRSSSSLFLRETKNTTLKVFSNLLCYPLYCTVRVSQNTVYMIVLRILIRAEQPSRSLRATSNATNKSEERSIRRSPSRKSH